MFVFNLKSFKNPSVNTIGNVIQLFLFRKLVSRSITYFIIRFTYINDVLQQWFELVLLHMRLESS